MSISKLERETWQGFFDDVSRTLEGKTAEVEIDGLAIGAQIAAEWLPMIGIVYDHRDDLVEIALEGLDHLIRRPREIYVDCVGTELHSMEVIDSDDVRHIVRLRDPLLLSPPARPSINPEQPQGRL
jgi:hypothetical protein